MREVSVTDTRSVHCPFCEVPAGAMCVDANGINRDREHFARQNLARTGLVSHAPTQRETIAYLCRRLQTPCVSVTDAIDVSVPKTIGASWLNRLHGTTRQ